MKKLHKTIIPSLAMLFCATLTSCDNAYDLTKNINTEITVGTKYSIPLGKTEKIFLSRLVTTGENLKVNNAGIYEIAMKGNLNSHVSEVAPVNLTGFDPILEDIKIDFNALQSKMKSNARSIVNIDSEFTNFTNYDINVKLPAEVDKLSAAELSTNGITPVTTTMEISLRNLFPEGVEQIYFRNFKIVLPEIFKIAGQESSIITYPELVLTRNNPKVSIVIKFESIKLNEAQQQKYIVETAGNKYLVINSELLVSSKVSIPVDPEKLNANSIILRFQYSSPQIQIRKVTGTFIPDIKISEKVALDDIPDLIKGEGSKFDITDIALNLDYNNTINMQLSTNLVITPWNDKLNKAAGSPVNVYLKEIKAGILNKFVISNTARTVPAGSVNIVVPSLTTLLDVIPDSYIISSDKVVAQSVTSSQNFELGKAYDITGDYNLVVPFKFNNLDITYTDSIHNLLKDLVDVVDLTKEITVTAQSVSTLPTDLKFSVKMLDANDNELNGIVVNLTKFMVDASIDEVESINDIEFKLTEKEGSHDLSLLNKIVYNANATSLDGKKDIELKPTQYIFVKNIIVKVPNGINVKL